MEDKTIVFVDLKGSAGSTISFISDILRLVEKLPKNAVDKNTWGDAYFAAFDSATDAVRHALEVRDSLRYHDWRAVGIDSAPKLRTSIATGPVTWKQDSIDDLRERLVGRVFVEGARLEPVVTPGEVWATAAVVSKANLGPKKEFYFEDLGDVTLPKGFGSLPAFRAQWQKDASWLKKGIQLPLDDIQYRARGNALRRFALLYLLLDQLPIGSWGRSTSSWMNSVWHDIPRIPHNPFIEDEGGFETTVLNIQLLFQLFGNDFRLTKVCSYAYRYLEHRHNSRGFGMLSLARHGAEIEPGPRHTALAAWLLGTVAGDPSLKDANSKQLFRLACVALFSGDPASTLKQFLGDRHPLMLYLAASQVVRRLDSPEWQGILTAAEMKRTLATWAHCRDELKLRALESEYPRDAAGPPHLLEQRGAIFPVTVPYGGFVRTETYSVLSSALLCDASTDHTVKSRIAQAIAYIANDYLNSFGSPELRYSRDALRPFPSQSNGLTRYRGVAPYFGEKATPDLGCTALLYRLLRAPHLKSVIHENWQNPDVGIEQTRFFLEEDLIQQFDRYLVAPELFSLSHSGMFASLLVGDKSNLVEALRNGFEEYLEHPRTALNVREATLSTVLSEKFLNETVETLICTDETVDPKVLQISTNSLVRLLVDRVRPGRYALEEQLSPSVIRTVCRGTAKVYEDAAFVKKYHYTWGKTVDESILKPFLSMISPSSRILDVGSGTGQYAHEFLKAGHAVDLFDISKPALELASRRIGKSSPRVHYFAGDITETSGRAVVPKEPYYDAIWCSAVLVNVPRSAWAEILEWFKSLLGNSSTLFVNMMIDNPCLFSRDGRYFTYLRSASEFEQTLAKSGFEVSHSLRKKISRNTYSEPLLQRSWVNFYAKPSIYSEPELGPIAASMTALAYERSFNVFDRMHSKRPERSQRIERYIATLSQHFKNPEGVKILDVGCGTGDVVKSLLQQGYTVTGIDISEQMIAMTQSRIADAKEGAASLDVCDVCELPAAWTAQFDAALCITSLQHQPVIGGSFDKAVSELHRVLKLGGILRIDSRIGFDSGFDPDLRYIEAFSSASEVLDRVQRVGFECINQANFELAPGENSFKRDLKIEFAEFWLRKTS